jgi:hypothetical protein
LHPVLRALCGLGGFAFGALFGGGIGFFLIMGAVGFEGFNRHRWMAFISAATLCVTAVSLLVWGVRKIRARSTIPVELRCSARWCFEIGFLLGSGFTCLLEGICFAIASVSS